MLNLASWHLWVIGGVLLIIMEMFTLSFFLASFGVAAFITAIAAAYDASLEWQLGVFAIANVFLLIFLRPFVVKGLYRRSDDRPTNCHALVGTKALVVDSITDANRPGRVKLGGEEWRGLSFDGSSIPEDTVVEVVSIDGSTLTVRPLLK